MNFDDLFSPAISLLPEGLLLTFNPLVVGAVFLLGLGVLVAGIIGVKKGNYKPGFACLVLGAVALGVIAPGMYYDKIFLGGDTIHVWTGFWWKQSIRTLSLRGVGEVKMAMFARKGKKSRPRETWFFRFSVTKNGKLTPPVVYSPNDLWRRSRFIIWSHLQGRGIPLLNPIFE